MSNTQFRLDKQQLEKKISLFTNLQMAFVGAALMLMMMDLSKLMLLAPLGAGLILVSWYKTQCNNIYDEFKTCSIEFAPKSILVKKPAQDLEQRITFREIKDVTLHRQHLLPVVSIYLEEGDEAVELVAMENSEELLELLSSNTTSEG